MSYIPGPIDPELARYVIGTENGYLATTRDPADGWDVLQSEEGSRVVAIVQMQGYNYWVAAMRDGRVMVSTTTTTWQLRHTFDGTIVGAFPLPKDKAIIFTMTGGKLGACLFIEYVGVQWYQWEQWDESPIEVIFAVAAARLDDPENEIVLVGSGGRIEKTGSLIGNHPMNTTVANSPFNGTPILAVARGDGMWVCGGGEGKLAYSSDGINWTLTDSAFDGSCIYHIAFDNVLGWLAVGAEGKVSRSLDGVIWDAVDMASESDCAVDYSGRRVDHRWLSATAAGNCWMVAGDGNVVATLCECPDCYYYDGGSTDTNVPIDGVVIAFYHDWQDESGNWIEFGPSGNMGTVSPGVFFAVYDRNSSRFLLGGERTIVINGVYATDSTWHVPGVWGCFWFEGSTGSFSATVVVSNLSGGEGSTCETGYFTWSAPS